MLLLKLFSPCLCSPAPVTDPETVPVTITDYTDYTPVTDSAEVSVQVLVTVAVTITDYTDVTVLVKVITDYTDSADVSGQVKVITDYTDSTDYTDYKADTDSVDVSCSGKGHHGLHGFR